MDGDSLELNVNVTESSLVVEPFAGPESMVVSGAVASTVKVREAGDGSVCPPATGPDVEGVRAAR